MDSSLSIKELSATINPDMAKYVRCHDLCEGGDGFEARIDNYLIKKKTCVPNVSPSPQTDLENPFPAGKWSGDNGDTDHENKKKYFHFVPHTAGIFDQISGAASEDPVKLFAKPKKNISYAYYENLEERMQFNTKPSIKSILLYACPFLAISFPPQQQTDLMTAQAAGMYDATLNLIQPADVLDCEWLDDETMSWVKTRRVEQIRSKPYLVPDTNRETITYFTPDQIISYSWEWPIAQPDLEPKDDFVVIPKVEAHSLGACPILPLCLPGKIWAADRLIAPILDLLNCEATLRLWVTIQGHPILTAPDGNNLPRTIPNSPSSCVIGSLTFVVPPSDGYAALSKEVDKARDNLMSTLMAIARDAINETQNARQSAEAKRIDISISGLSEYILGHMHRYKCILKKALKLIMKIRGDDPDSVELQGLTNIQGRSIEQRIQALMNTGSIQEYPPLARKWEAMKIALDANPTLPKELRDKIWEQFDKDSNEPIEPLQDVEDETEDDENPVETSEELDEEPEESTPEETE